MKKINSFFDGRVIGVVLPIALLLYSSMFLTCRIFVEPELISKSYAFIGGSLLSGIICLLLIKKQTLIIDLITVLAGLFIGYLLICGMYAGLMLNNTRVLSYVAFFILFLTFKLIRSLHAHRYIILIAVIICMAQAAYGLMQYTGLFPVNKTFRVIGSFENPAGFAACLAASFPLCFSVLRNTGWQRYFGIGAIAAIGLSIILSESRAGIIAITTVSILFLGNKYYHLLKKHRKYLLLLFAMLIMVAIGLFFQKRDSAVGRILIWRNTLEMIADKPMFGHGTGGFMATYMNYQANYINANPDNFHSQLADNVTHPFNEYILLAVEYGVLGPSLLVVLITIIIKSSRRITPPLMCLLSIAVFACFSYPLRYPFVLVLLAFSLASIHMKGRVSFRLPVVSRIIASAFLAIVACFLIRDISFERVWGNLVGKTVFISKDESSKEYADLYERWNGDPMFLYNYGAILNRAKNYEDSNHVMYQCKQYLNDYDVQMIIADNFYQMKQWKDAEQHYVIALNMIPNRFMPLYKLLLLYEATNNQQKMLDTATEIVNKKVKIPSPVINQIINEAKIRQKTVTATLRKL